MINVNINIITRTIPATPRSNDYPQGYSITAKLMSKINITTEIQNRDATKSRASSESQIDILQFIRDNRTDVIAALMDENGIISIKGSIRATGDIVSNQNF